jgi:hypothetical protein
MGESAACAYSARRARSDQYCTLNTATGRRRDVGTSTLTECRGLDVLNEYGKPVFRISLLAELLEAQVTESVAVDARA